ncbi:AMP-dependent synthetase and ligase [Novosphingobium aromaticivorans DSM 12444]|uniref:AMP-dependent synthetase and ligase n=1 Tax=Novosphingobium aromaticivorans (strain ATCC 700278 / DSM 12444 / CCUG 56034 / CIP 105152 / NBRC 16084 / F199) TaxID=279238 RepID=Q2G5U8_NOVAD|nr:acyl-CoA ligase (AMP-forming), exosortase A system-associated [Novosphingobium aromaticivorans]ABD26775.1 AMP-dependent synthetase and ligase [Novosphingobium aromaticivorans DSM 12444]SCY41751.1 acyl-CoA ligase (AMP-forming), exosortase A-associated [Novosphingobium aromaticivorans]
MTAEPDPTVHPLDHLALRGERGAPALVLRNHTLTHEALNARVGLLANWLQSRVPERGARVATWLPKSELSCLMPLAAVRASLVHVPVNPLLKRGQVAHILADSGAALLVSNKARLDSLEPGDASCPLIEEPAAWAEAEALGGQLPPSDAAPDSLAAILYTSGSTGRPKGVMLSQANLWLGAVSVAHYLRLSPADRVLAVLPLAFDYGQNQLLSTWYAGGSVVPLDYLTPRDVVKAVERHGITTIAAVPPLWLQLAELDWPEAARSLRRLTNSGGALTPSLVRALRTRFPEADLYPMYGLTEAFRSTYLDPALVDSHPTSIGRAIPFAEVSVVNDLGDEAEVEEEGELVHAGPLVAQGYWQDAERTAERFRPAPPFSKLGGMAVWSGDRVRRDAEGLLHFVGRRDAMIKTSGNRVSPQEVEEAAVATGLVAEAVALGLPDPHLGHAIHLVARASGDVEAARAGLLPALTRALPNFMVPRQVHWRQVMPVSPNGKLDRVALAAELAQDVQA